MTAQPITTSGDSPVVIALPSDGDLALRVVRIADAVAGAAATQLPGVRVGDGDGTGYAFLRSLDGQLVFVPDQDFSGVTDFHCVLADDNGREHEFRAKVQVEPVSDSETPDQITLANGSTSAQVTAGIGTAIIGALQIATDTRQPLQTVQVYEAGCDVPSERFSVTAGRLQVIAPLDDVADAFVHLKLAAFDDAFQFAAGDISVEVLAAAARPFGHGEGHAGFRPMLAYSAEDDGGGHDAFVFESESIEPKTGGTEPASAEPVWPTGTTSVVTGGGDFEF